MVETKNKFDAIISFVEKRFFAVRYSHCEIQKSVGRYTMGKAFPHLPNFFD